MNKETGLILIIIFFAMNDVFPQVMNLKFDESDGRFYTLQLPYKKRRDIKNIFTDEMQIAIDIQEITVDNELLLSEINPVLVEFDVFLAMRPVAKEEEDLVFLMFWHKIYKNKLIWWDGKNLDDCYIIRKGNNEMRIKYRIIYPFPFMTLKKLMDRRIPASAYSEYYEVIVDLQDIFSTDI